MRKHTLILEPSNCENGGIGAGAGAGALLAAVMQTDNYAADAAADQERARSTQTQEGREFGFS